MFFFIVGIYFCVVLPFGPGSGNLPGDLGDARLNNYILEHFYRWLTGLDASYWSASFFYPFPYSIAFSENLLGSAPIYALLRFAGLNDAASFQGWFLAGYSLNFLACMYVLSKLGFHPLAVGAGSFLFTFSLPVLAQENHAQLVYRCFVPIACYYLWGTYRSPGLKNLFLFLGAMIAQFYLCIYTGFFLIVLAAMLMLLLTGMELINGSLRTFMLKFREGLRDDWLHLPARQRIFFVGSFLALLAGFILLMFPYYHVSRLYGFTRTWHEVALFLPRPESFLLADNSKIWASLGSTFSDVPRRDEQQLFPGGAVLLLLGIGVPLLSLIRENKIPLLHLLAALILGALTLNINGYSLYEVLYDLPGLSAIRAVQRLMLILIWPVAVYSAWVMDTLLKSIGRYKNAGMIAVLAILVLMTAESIYYEHATYSIREAEARLVELKQRIIMPDEEVESPILFLAGIPEVDTWMTEIDAMIVARDLGWATYNGYSGNIPPDYEPAQTCRKLRRRIQTYMEFTGRTDDQFYFDLMDRSVVVGFEDCNSSWWNQPP